MTPHGEPVTLYANYLPLEMTGKSLFRYRLDIAIGNTHLLATAKEAEQIVRVLLEVHLLEYQNNIATDYRSTLLSTRQLPAPSKYCVRYQKPHEQMHSEKSRVYNVTCQYVGTINTRDLVDYLTSTYAHAPSNPSLGP